MPALRSGWRKLSNSFRNKTAPKTEDNEVHNSDVKQIPYEDSSNAFIQQVFSPVTFAHANKPLGSPPSTNKGSDGMRLRPEEKRSIENVTARSGDNGDVSGSLDFGDTLNYSETPILVKEHGPGQEPQFHESYGLLATSLSGSQADRRDPRVNLTTEEHISDENDVQEFTDRALLRVPTELWLLIVDSLDPCSAASLACVNRQTSRLLGAEVWKALNEPSNRSHKVRFLQFSEHAFPKHVLCHACGIYHPRRNFGKDHRLLQSTTITTSAKNSVAQNCARSELIPSVRLTFDVALPFTLAHLVTQRQRHGNSSEWGIPLSVLSKSWSPAISDWTTTAEWFHRAKFVIDKRGHLLMKVSSTFWTAADLTDCERRLALSCRKDYTANYSTCPHEALGSRLFRICECALGHIPSTKSSLSGSKGPKGTPFTPPQRMGAGGCATCLPLFRCLVCPTEYKIGVQLKEFRIGRGALAFRHAIVVTRWSDLGDAWAPYSPEWRACGSLGGSAVTDESDWEFFKVKGESLKEKTVRNRFEYAAGGRLSEVDAVPLRRWNSRSRIETDLMRDDDGRLEMFLRGY